MNIQQIEYNPFDFSHSYCIFVSKSIAKTKDIIRKKKNYNIQISNIALAKSVRSLWLVHNRYLSQLHENMETISRKRRSVINSIVLKSKEFSKLFSDWSKEKNVYNTNQINYFEKVIVTLNKTIEIIEKRNLKNVNVLLQTTNMPTDVINHVLSFL